MAILLGRYPRILRVLEMMSTIYQKFYDKTMEFLLSVPGIKVLIVYYFRFLMQFRLACMDIGERYTQMELGIIGVFLATVASRLRFAGVFVTISLIFCYLELQFQNMARFYRKRPTLLAQHFPEGQDPKRNMHRITQAVVDSLSNPTVVAVGAGVAGALGWKALDVWDTTKQERMAEKDREAASINAQKDREAEDHRHRENLEAEDRRHKETLEAEEHRALLIAERERTAEYIRHKESLEAEALQRQLDREAEYKRHRETLEAEDRRHLENLEIENQKNRENRLSDIDYSKNTTSSIESSEGFVDSTQIVD